MEINTILKHYNVSKDGVITSLRTGKKLLLEDNKGYSRVTFSIDNNQKRFQVHRLVALIYIENPDNKPQVNHINGIKTDNSVENLEWSTAQENVQHAIDTGLHKMSGANWAKAVEKIQSMSDKEKEKLGKSGKDNNAYGINYFKDMSDEKKELLLKKRNETAKRNGTVNKGVPNPVKIDSIVYESVTKAGKALGYSPKWVKRRVESSEYPNFNYVKGGLN